MIGAGYWGPNLIRNFAGCPLTRVAAICDTQADALNRMIASYPQPVPCQSIDMLLDQELDAVAIATPVSTHAPLASRCQEAGLHVMVEKPLAASTAEARTLVELAEKHQRVLMVDHTYLFCNPIRKIKQLLDGGELGDLYYIDSIRINLGLFQHNMNVVWDLAPHDLAILDYLLGRPVQSLSAQGCGHSVSNLADIAYLHLNYGNSLLASIHVNWLSPIKIRQMILGGSRKSLVYNELNLAEPLKVYDRGIITQPEPGELQRLMVGYRTGDTWSPNIEPGEALQAAVLHFAECIRNQSVPISDGRLGLRVVELLEAANRSLGAQGSVERLGLESL